MVDLALRVLLQAVAEPEHAVGQSRAASDLPEIGHRVTSDRLPVDIARATYALVEPGQNCVEASNWRSTARGPRRRGRSRARCVSIGYLSKHGVELAAQLGGLAAFEPPVAGVQQEAADVPAMVRTSAGLSMTGCSVRAVAPLVREAVGREQGARPGVEHPAGVDQADRRLEHMKDAVVADTQAQILRATPAWS